MKRDEREDSNLGLWVLGGAVVVVGGGLLAAWIFGGDAPAPAPSALGFRLLPACGGVEVLDEPKAMAAARASGGQASVYDEQSGYLGWVAAAAETLGLGGAMTCDPANVPPASLSFAYRLVREYLAGAVAAKKISAEDATVGLDVGRAKLLFQGVDAAQLPEGLPS